MRMFLRRLTDNIFSWLAICSVILLVAVLVVVLGPMMLRGASAVVFRETIEFRQMQYALYGRGNAEKIKAETAEVEKAEQSIYEMIDRFKKGIDTEDLIDKTRKKYREYKKQLRYKKTTPEKYRELTEKAGQFRDALCEAYAGVDKSVITKTRFSGMLRHGQDGRGTLYLIFRNINSGLCRNMPEAIKR